MASGGPAALARQAVIAWSENGEFPRAAAPGGAHPYNDADYSLLAMHRLAHRISGSVRVLLIAGFALVSRARDTVS